MTQTAKPNHPFDNGIFYICVFYGITIAASCMGASNIEALVAGFAVTVLVLISDLK